MVTVLTSLVPTPESGPSRRRGPARCAVIASSATSAAPLANEGSCEARKSATLAISRASPRRPQAPTRLVTPDLH